MRQSVINICLVSLLTILLAGCGGNSSSPPEITGVSPDTGPPGLEVTIEGTNFSSDESRVSASFDGTSAEIKEATPFEIVTLVPEGATTGPVSLTIAGETATGPIFTVEARAPAIQAIEPISGKFGTEVTITGINFGITPNENKVTFSGTEASVTSASETELITQVPEGAETGPIEVTVEDKTGKGPEFMIDPSQAFEGEYEIQEYELQLQSATDTTLTIESGSEIEIDLVKNSPDEVEIDVEEFVEDTFNAADTALGGTGTAIVDFEEGPTAEITENEFELDDTDFEISGNDDSVPGEISGEGVLEDGTIVFTFEFILQDTDATIIFSGEVDLQKQ